MSIENDAQTTRRSSVATEIFALDAEVGAIGARCCKRSPAQRVSVAAKSASTISARLNDDRQPSPVGAAADSRSHIATSQSRRVSHDGKTIDRYETRFGIRSLRFDPNKGVFVNDEHIPI